MPFLFIYLFILGRVGVRHVSEHKAELDRVKTIKMLFQKHKTPVKMFFKKYNMGE